MYPLRLAAIDVGSNAIRFLAVAAKAPGKRRTIDQVRIPLRLGHDVFTTGALSSTTIDEALHAFRDFARRMRGLEIARYRAVATSAVRESANGALLVERAAREAGLEIEPIDGNEEARLVHLAVRDRVQLGDEKSLLVDLGGGSLEISTIDASGIYDTVSLPLGSVRLMEALGSGASLEATRQQIAGHRAELAAVPALKRKCVRLIATGGNIEEVARLIAGGSSQRQTVEVSIEQLAQTIARVSALNIEARIRELGMRADRADVIVPAALVYQAVAEAAQVNALLVPFAGVKEGVIIDLLSSEVD